MNITVNGITYHVATEEQLRHLCDLLQRGDVGNRILANYLYQAAA